ncbi:unnamed protein product [Amoebophrya sp. A120]|nr:unnamed protein product [Amoebophrya sp. A120]|eukprot:GSA120T00004096001.1
MMATSSSSSSSSRLPAPGFSASTAAARSATSGASSGGYLIFCCVDAVTERSKNSLEARFECVVELRSSSATGGRKIVTPVPSTAEGHILLELPSSTETEQTGAGAPASSTHDIHITLYSANNSSVAHQEQGVSGPSSSSGSSSGSSLEVGSAVLSYPLSLVPNATLDRWIPLNGTRYCFEESEPQQPSPTKSRAPRLRVLCKYVPGDYAAAESDIDRTFHCQDFLILALQSLSDASSMSSPDLVVGSGTTTTSSFATGGGTIPGAYSHQNKIDLVSGQGLAAAASSSLDGVSKVPQIERIELTTNPNSLLSSPAYINDSLRSNDGHQARSCASQSLELEKLSGNEFESGRAVAPFLFVSDANTGGAPYDPFTSTGFATQDAGVSSASTRPNPSAPGSRMANRASTRSTKSGPQGGVTSSSVSAGTSRQHSPGKRTKKGTGRLASSSSASTLPAGGTTSGDASQSDHAASTLSNLKKRISEGKGFAPLPRVAGGNVVFKSTKDFEDACWERIRPYHQIIDVLETKLESAGYERENVEIYKRAAAALRVQSGATQEKFKESCNLFERKLTEYAKLVDERTAEVNTLRTQLNEVRSSRDSALDEVTLHKNAKAMSDTEPVEARVLLKQIQALDKMFNAEKTFKENLEKQRQAEKTLYTENELKLRGQIEELTEQLQATENEYGRTTVRLQENLQLTTAERQSFQEWRKREDDYQMKIMTLESEVRDAKYSKSLVSDLKAQIARQDEQLTTRARQLEELRETFEKQLKQELETQQKLVREKQEANEELRKVQRNFGGGGSAAGTPTSTAKSPGATAAMWNNQRALEQQITLLTSKCLEMEQRLIIAGDMEKQREQMENFCKDLEQRVAVLVSEKEAQEQQFAEHMASEKSRSELLEKDNADLKQLLQEIQPEFHKVQTELEKATFQAKEAEARMAVNGEEKKLRDKLKEELEDVVAECAMLRKGRDQIQAEYAERSNRLWDEYVPKEEARKMKRALLVQQSHATSAYPQSAPSSTIHGPGSHSSSPNLSVRTPMSATGFPSHSFQHSTPGTTASHHQLQQHFHLPAGSQYQMKTPPASSGKMPALNKTPVVFPSDQQNNIESTTINNYRYVPVKADSVDKALATLINQAKPPVPFYRLSPGIYLYGSRKVLVKLTKQNKLIFRVGGGYCNFHEFLEQFTTLEHKTVAGSSGQNSPQG